MRRLMSLLLMFSFILFPVSFELGAAKDVTKTTSEKSQIVGVVDYVIGKVLIKKAGTKRWVKLRLKTRVTKKDEIRTFDKSRVKIKLRGKKILEIGPKTKIRISRLLKRAKEGKKTTSYGVTAVAGVRGADASKKKVVVKSDELEWEE